MTQLTPLAQDYIGRFDSALASLPGHDSPALARLRRNSLDIFAGLDFPNHRIEEWKFTSLNALTKGLTDETVEIANRATAPAFDAAHVLTFVNGRFSAEKSRIDGLPDGARLTSLREELDSGNDRYIADSKEETRAVVALNTAFMEDGYILELEAGVILDKPLLVRFESTADAGAGSWHLRNIIRLEKDAKATVLEEHVSDSGHSYFSNPMTRITLAEGAILHHYRLQDESHAAFHIAVTDCSLGDKATYDNFSLSLGGRLSRNEISADILGSGARVGLNGAYLMRDRQHCDTTTLTRHLVPENDSRQVYKGVLDGESRGIFQGKIHIAVDAQKVAGDQLSKALLLSDRATMACKPELEIYADDVKCSHGATSGELDEDALFYLQSRGISEAEARKMLITAFLTDVMEEISDDKIREYFSSLATGWLDTV